MLGLFQKTIYDIDPPAFGLDISDRSLKVAMIKKEAEHWSLASFYTASVPRGVITNGEIVDQKKASSIIRRSLQRVYGEKIRSRYVVCSLPEEKAFTRVIQLPKMRQSEAKEAVKWEAENNIPFRIDEVYLDWQVIHPIENHLDHCDILIVAAPRALIDGYSELLEGSNLIPKIFEVESIAIVRSVVKESISKIPILIIDLGQMRTSFIIFSGYALRLTSSLEISGTSLTDVIAKGLNLDQKTAEKIKKHYGLSRKDKTGEQVFECLVPALTDLVEQIKNLINFYQSHAKHQHLTKFDVPTSVSKIILCGGGATLKGLDSFLALNLKINVEKANPWVNILRSPLREVPELSYEKSLSYTTALGLALRGAKKF